jgi:hypothetical protein
MNDTVGPVRTVHRFRYRAATQEFRDNWEETFGAKSEGPPSPASTNDSKEAAVTPGSLPTAP